MEIFEEEEKTKNRSTKILLVINLIIWGIILFMVVLWNGVVNAATTNYPMNNYTVKYTGGAQNVNNNTEYTVSIPVNEISFVFGNTEGVLVGTVWLTIDNTNIDSPNDFQIIIFNNNTRDNTGTATKNCSVTTGTNQGKKIRCQIDINITNTTQKYLQVNAKFDPSITTFSKITANGQIVSTPAVQPATAEDIQSQTISIINNAIENALNQSQTIIQSNQDLSDSIANIMNNATNSIQNSLMHCQSLSYTETENIDIENKGLSYSGTYIDTNNWNISKYTPVNANKNYILTVGYANGSINYCLYDKNKTLLNCNTYTQSRSLTLTITPQQDGYIRYSMTKTSYYSGVVFSGTYCQSNTDAIIENQNQNTAEIIAAIGGLEGYHTQYTPDTSDFEDLEDAEDTLHQYTNVNLDDFEISIDSSTSNWVWNTLTSILNTSSIVFGYVISILSIGLIKLILNR